jgi:uncharacterized membrane protein
MTEKEKDKIYSRMHDERNLSDSIIGIFVCSVILYLLLKMIECIFYGNVFTT